MTLQWRHLTGMTSAREPRSTPTGKSHADGRHPKMKDEKAPRVSSPHTQRPSVSMRKTPNSQGGKLNKISDPSPPQSCPGHQQQGKSEDYQSPEEAEEMGHLNITGVLIRVLGQKRTPGRHEASWMKQDPSQQESLHNTGIPQETRKKSNK